MTRRRGKSSTAGQQRRDSIEQFVNGGRQELADKGNGRIVVLEAYLTRLRIGRYRRAVMEAMRRPAPLRLKIWAAYEGRHGAVGRADDRRQGRQRDRAKNTRRRVAAWRRIGSTSPEDSHKQSIALPFAASPAPRH